MTTQSLVGDFWHHGYFVLKLEIYAKKYKKFPIENRLVIALLFFFLFFIEIFVLLMVFRAYVPDE